MAMQATQGSPREETAELSLEERLRGMITSHQQHQRHQRDQDPASGARPPVQQSVQQSISPRNLLHGPAGYIRTSHYTPLPPQPPPPGFVAMDRMPTPQYFSRQEPRRAQGGPPVQPPIRGPDSPSSRYPQPCRNWSAPIRAPAPAPVAQSLDHFPPLGKENPEGKQQVPYSVHSYQRADQSRGQQHHRSESGPLTANNGRFPTGMFDPRLAGLPPARYEQFFVEQAANLERLARSLVKDISPPDQETTAKNELLRVLQVICRTLVPTAELIPFGSLVTGFSTASSDIDCVFVCGPLNDPSTPEVSDDLPALLEQRLKEEDFEVMLLLRTRVPIIKMKQKTSHGSGEIHCDIGFKNYLAIHNTHLLLCYSNCDVRVKQMVLFVKWWAKKRHINSPYRGTLSSYGYVLMILHYLINIAQPPVLPNLQLQPIPRGTADSEIHFRQGENEYNIWFAKDVKNIGPSRNSSSLGELLRGFFDYYSFKFAWGQSVVSIRTQGGLLTKQEKDWCIAKSRPANTSDGAETWEVKDRYLFAIEDPFETVHNVGRTCNNPGVRRIRDELRRAMSLIKFRGDGGRRLERSLCEEAPPERPYVRRWEAREPQNPDAVKGPGGGERATERAPTRLPLFRDTTCEKALDSMKSLSLNGG